MRAAGWRGAEDANWLWGRPGANESGAERNGESVSEANRMGGPRGERAGKPGARAWRVPRPYVATRHARKRAPHLSDDPSPKRETSGEQSRLCYENRRGCVWV